MIKFKFEGWYLVGPCTFGDLVGPWRDFETAKKEAAKPKYGNDFRPVYIKGTAVYTHTEGEEP